MSREADAKGPTPPWTPQGLRSALARRPATWWPLGLALLPACVTQAEIDRLLDRDQDGYRTVEAGGRDCDDADPSIHPDADERCDDGLDNCDGLIDDVGEGAVVWYPDDDGDGFGRNDVARERCATADPLGWARQPGDCDDGDARARPGVREVCDGVDNDCDEQIDEGCQAVYELRSPPLSRACPGCAAGLVRAPR